MPGPRSPDYYKLPGCRLFYGVDYGRYMFALAREIGAIPNLWSWSLKNPRVAFASAFGQAHVPIFRLDGPFRTAEAEDTVAKGKLKLSLAARLIKALSSSIDLWKEGIEKVRTPKYNRTFR